MLKPRTAPEQILSQQAARKVAPTVQLQLFEAAPHPAVEALKELDVESMTPLEALQKLAELKRKAEG